MYSTAVNTLFEEGMDIRACFNSRATGFMQHNLRNMGIYITQCTLLNITAVILYFLLDMPILSMLDTSSQRLIPRLKQTQRTENDTLTLPPTAMPQ
jgi:hypothetical protein